MMKKLLLVSAVLVTGCATAADKPADKPWHNAKPSLSTINAPTKVLPMVCKQEQAMAYLKELQSGAKDIYSIKSNDHGGKGANDSGWLTWRVDDPSNLIACPEGGAAATEVGMCWKELNDEPTVIGLVRVAPGTAAPHYHREMECYYGITGAGLTWSQERMQPFGAGDYIEIPSKAMHYTPNTFDDQDLIYMYWFPLDGKFSTFKYQWPKDVGPGEQLMFDFIPYTNSKLVRSGNGGYGWDVIKKAK